MEHVTYHGFSKVFVTCLVMLLCVHDCVQSDEDFINPALKILYTNQFKFHLKNARFLGIVQGQANDLGFVYKGHIVTFLYLFIRDDIPRFSKSPYDSTKLKEAEEKLSKYVESIVQDYERKWDDQFEHIPANRSSATPDSNDEPFVQVESIVQDYERKWDDQFEHIPANRSSATPDSNDEPFVQYSGSEGSLEEECEKREVYVAFIDLGFELDHPNLVQSTEASLSYDFIWNRKNVKPPFYGSDIKDSWGDAVYDELSHGTRAMGRVGAVILDSHNVTNCDKGVAPNVRLVGLKAIDLETGLSDTREALALSYRQDVIDVFSCSYGIQDNKGFHGPNEAVKQVLMEGATKSMSCRGVIYMFPSGYGHHDNCNADGYANSIYTITIAQVTRNGTLPRNREICSAAIAAAQGDGYATTELNGRCSYEFDGSSASCAVAAGYAGQLRSLRPCLSKRDIEHIMVRTAITNNNISWRKNGAGRKFNDEIGFGELNLHRMLEAAKTWTFVPEVHTCKIIPKDTAYKHINDTNWILTTTVASDGCRQQPNHVAYLEHVQVVMNLHCSHIFQVAIRLISPSGTVSNILTRINIADGRSEKFKKLNWTFMSVNFWGEASNGTWIIEVRIENSTSEVECKYNVEMLLLHGTDTDPEQGGGPLTCKDTPDDDNTESSQPISVKFLALIVVMAIVIPVIVISVIYCHRKKCIRCKNNNNASYTNVRQIEQENIEMNSVSA